MSENPQSVKDDLAYIRGIVEGGGDSSAMAVTGETFVAGGLIYGLQTLSYWAQALGWFHVDGPTGLALASAPTVLFLGVLFWIIRRHRTTPKGSAAMRALGSILSAIGMANLVLLAVFATVSTRHNSFIIWLLHPITVFVLMGTGFLAIGTVRRRPWAIGVAIGWWACAIGGAFTVGTANFLIFLCLGLFGCMMIPGLIMMRRPSAV